jgi:hypothetical protein
MVHKSATTVGITQNVTRDSTQPECRQVYVDYTENVAPAQRGKFMRALIMFVLTLWGSLVFTGVGDSQYAAASETPTDQEIKKALAEKLIGDYDMPTNRVLSFAVGAIRKGQTMLQQVVCGAPAQPVIPVKVIVVMETQALGQVVRGEEPDDIFYFYKDGFGDWSVKLGPERVCPGSLRYSW